MWGCVIKIKGTKLYYKRSLHEPVLITYSELKSVRLTPSSAFVFEVKSQFIIIINSVWSLTIGLRRNKGK